MRRTSSLLWSSTALIALIALAAPASAQQADPATPPDPTVEAQESPADPEAGSPQTDDAVQTATGQDQATPGDDTIVVTGLRRSIQSAQNIKRNSEQIVDAIVAEDIGKLPDVTASAALARVTGVQVTRSAGEAADVQIRGLPDISTTYNSREIFTANERFVAIQDFPAGSVAALEVFKSGTANLIEGGLGGQVNVRSRKPFDFNGFELSGSFNVVRFTQSDETDWNGNILVSNRWNVGDGGEIGVLVNAAMTNINFLDSTREQSLVMRDIGGGVRIPDAAGLFYGGGDRYRPSGNFAVEYRPNSDLRFYVDGLYQGYRGDDSNLFMLIPNWDTTITDVDLGSDGLADSVTTTGGSAPDGFQEFIKAKTDTYQIGGGFSYDMGAIRWSGDIAYTDSKFTRRQVNVDFALASSPDREFNFDVDGTPGGGSFDFLDFDPSDGSNWLYRGLFLRNEKRTGDDVQMRTDVEWDTGFDNFTRLQVGLRHNNRDAGFQQSSPESPGGEYRGGPFPRPLLSDIPASTGGLPCGFDYDNDFEERCLFGTNFNSVFGNIDELAAYAGFPDSDIEYDPLRAYTANEKASAAYGQLRYEFDAGFPIDGVIGMRAVRTKLNIEGIRRTFPGNVQTPLNETNTYTDWLPNISTRLQFTPQLQGRLAYNETRTRPSFGQLNPGSTLDQPVGACETEGPTSPTCFRTGGGGNPDLKPITSRNYDATLEYYFARQGSVALALFRRDVRGFIFNDTVDIPEGTEVNFIRFNSPQNAGKGKIKGFELAGTVFADNFGAPDWASGFGLQANYTYIDATTELAPNFTAALPGQQRFPGVSKHAYNLIGMYERGKVTARLAYNWRSKFVREYQDIQGFQSPLIQKSLGQLDFSASYTPIENLTIAFDALNLLAGKQPIRTERAFNEEGDTYAWGTKFLERVFSLGARFRFGGSRSRSAPPPPVLLPPPPQPVIQPAPVIEQPAPPPPPGERG